MEKEENNIQDQEFKGRNLEEVISLAEHVLQLPRSRIEYEIVAEKTKLFGMRSKEIVIRAWPKEIIKDDPVSEFLGKMLACVPLELNFQITKKNDITYVVFEGKDKHLLLRKEASLLLAMQHVLNKVFPQKIQVDCDFYRKRKERKLKEYAQRIGQQVSETGKKEILEMMNPYERRIVHMTINNISGITSESIGEGFLKRIKIFPVRNQTD